MINSKYFGIKTPKQPSKFLGSHGHPRKSQKFHKFGPMFWDRSNGPSRPQTNRNISKTFKMEIKPAYGENPTSRSLKKLPIPESTCSRLRVERFSFSPRRPPTIGSLVFLERSPLSLLSSPRMEATASPPNDPHGFSFGLMEEKKNYSLFCHLVT